MKTKNLIPLLLIVVVNVFLIGCDDDPQPNIVEEDVIGFDASISDTTLSANAHTLLIEFNPKTQYKDVISASNWDVQNVYCWDSSNEGFNYKEDFAEGGLDWVSCHKVEENGKTFLKISITENDGYVKRGLLICIGQKGSDKKSYMGVTSIMQEGKEEDAPFEVKVRYKGKIHSSMATLDENSHFVYENADFAEFMEDMAKCDDIEAVAQESGIIDYYDSDDVEAVAAIRCMMEPIDAFPTIEPRWPSFATRSDANPYRYMDANALAYCALFDDKGYKDTYIYQNFTSLTQFYDQERMKNIGLNDKVTSLAVAYNGNDSTICAVLTVWEDTDYNYGDNDRTKHRMNFVASYNNPTMGWRNLKHVPCLTGRDSWNDRISSISFHFGHYGSYLISY